MSRAWRYAVSPQLTLLHLVEPQLRLATNLLDSSYCVK